MRTYRIRRGKLPKALQCFAPFIRAAIGARRYAYCPYSKFSVGAVVQTEQRTDKGVDFFVGCNVENSIFEVTHAEEAAITHAVTALRGSKPRIISVVVALTAPEADQHALPCGLCRQCIREFGTPDTKIIGVKLQMASEEPWAIEVTTLGELLPFDFGPQNLKK